MATEPNHARALWRLFEPLHAVTYFAAVCRETMTDVGLKGFWMGYFAGRAAPMGPVAAAVVEATFFNFAPARVRRAIPDAWDRASPDDVVAARARAAAIALRDAARDADELTRRALPLLESAAAAADCGGRALAAANQALPPPADPVERLWQAATTLREHRGDGHVAALVTSRLDGVEAHVLAAHAAEGSARPEQLREARGWTDDEWAAAVERLAGRGLVEVDGDVVRATDDGHLVHARIEHVTDEIAWQPFRDGLTDAGRDLLPTVLRPFTRAVLSSGVLPFPNPIGLPEQATPGVG